MRHSSQNPIRMSVLIRSTSKPPTTCRACGKHEEHTPHPPTTMPVYSQPYTAAPAGIDRYWQTPLEVYTYLLYTPHERIRIQNVISQFWRHRRHVPVRIYHRCTTNIRLFAWTMDHEFVKQLRKLINYETNPPPRRRRRMQYPTN